MNFSFAHARGGVLLAALVMAAAPAMAQIELLGTGEIPGTALDDSGLKGLLEDGVTPKSQVGGLGSAIAYTGRGEFYYATPDRGPADGATTYPDRLYLLRIHLQPNFAVPGKFVVTPRIWDTELLRSEKGRRFIGSVAAFDPTNSPDSARLDPEGIRATGCDGNVFVSDEYGPFLNEFGPDGRRIRNIKIPNKFLIDLPSANVSTTDELTLNASGRQANRGMEGLAISPDGSKLYGMMQSPLIQDGGLSGIDRVGTNVRILEVDLVSGAFREFLYVLDRANRGVGVNEILAINDHEFLVLERDNRIGIEAELKRLYRIDITGATDIRGEKQLPSVGVPSGITPVSKELFLDLLDPAFGLQESVPEKIEGLAFGPDLADGRHLLIVSHDNDFVAANSSKFYAFAVPEAQLPTFEPQAVRFGHCSSGGSH